jgi:mannose-6-phosphate isomerase-like protein (cupin superfamily)
LEPKHLPPETKVLQKEPDYAAPDGSEIRLLLTMKGGGVCHCTLPVGKTSKAVAHRTVEEIWYIVGGQGDVWRKSGQQVEVISIHPGVSLTIPVGTHFQFRNTGAEPLCLLITTMPPWPGPQEAVGVSGHW